MQVSSFCEEYIFKMYLKEYAANTMKYAFHHAAAPHWYIYIVTLQAEWAHT